MVVFKFLTGDVNWLDYGGKWWSNKQEWNIEGQGKVAYWFILSLDNWDETMGGKHNGNSYLVSLVAIAPSLVPDREKGKALAFCGAEGLIKQVAPRHKMALLLECMASYGNSCPIQEWEGNNAKRLLSEAKQRAKAISSSPEGIAGCFGRTVNAIGSTGLEYMAGDIYRCLDRGPETTEKGIIRREDSTEVIQACRQVY